MVPIYTRPQIEAVLQPNDVVRVVEEGFAAYSRGETTIAPVGQLLFNHPEGDCHIKYGYRTGDTTFTVKIATGFPENVNKGLPCSNGIILVFSSQTGEILAILQDEGLLTDMRTAAAGAVAAKLLAPPNPECIGIVGAGTQAKLQLEYLKQVVPARKAMVWSRSRERAQMYRVDGFDVQVANSCAELARHCRLIVTTTASRQWLLSASDIQPGTHITAVGADGGGKQELEPALFARAAVCAVDSRKQCAEFGDSSYAISNGFIQLERLVELGDMIDGRKAGRTNPVQITVADLTGVAIQDIQIAALAMSLLA